MKTLKLTLTANAGVILEQKKHTVLVDALHREKTYEFSTLTAQQSENLLERYTREQPDLYLTTHFHPDHYSASLLERARKKWPACIFFGPDADLGRAFHFSVAGISVDAAVLPHDGKEYKDVINYGYFLGIEGCNILFLGDCATTAASSVGALVAGRRVDLAVLNFPWVCLDHARATVEKVILPQAVAVVHLPFREDDLSGFREAAFRDSCKLANTDIRIMAERMQEARFSFRL